MNGVDDWFTLSKLLAYPGAVAAVTLIVSMVAYLGGERVTPYLKWVALAFAYLLAYFAAYMTFGDWTVYVVAFFNGAVVFLAAVGLNQAVTVPAFERRLNTRGMLGKSYRAAASWL